MDEQNTDRIWTCTVCGYEHTGPYPPEICPICDAEAGLFEETSN